MDKRKRFLKLRERYRRRGKTFLYLDESGFAHSSQRTHGYAVRGQRVHGLRSGHSRPRTSLLAARHQGKIVAPCLFKGTCNTTVFNAWLEQQLCPILTENIVVIMDNATFHKSLRTRQLIENTGAALLFLPPYSPDLNPIEKTFGTMKRKRSDQPSLPLDHIVNMFC